MSWDLSIVRHAIRSVDDSPLLSQGSILRADKNQRKRPPKLHDGTSKMASDTREVLSATSALRLASWVPSNLYACRELRG